jgi:5S rRNA maturation endonuclease (ribonuclease M5)
MKFNPRLRQDIEKYKDYVFIVEGKKDVRALSNLGFDRVFMVHVPGLSLGESVEKIVGWLEKKDRVCILTDFDKEGKILYLKIKGLLSEMKGVRLDSSLRGLLIKARVSHVEGLDKFFEKIKEIG